MKQQFVVEIVLREDTNDIGPDAEQAGVKHANQPAEPNYKIERNGSNREGNDTRENADEKGCANQR